jgi:hypothetical protein
MINIITLGLVLSLVLIILIGMKRQKNKLIKKQLSGINSIVKMNDLIKSLQKHRGLSAAFCSGDDHVIHELRELVTQISSLVSVLDKAQTISANDRWFSFNDHWSRLSRHQQGISAEDSFKQHTNIIANILYLLEDIAEQHALTKEHLDGFINIGFLWR